MIGTPLALLGLFAIAVPVIIHLLGRHRSRVMRFPTLRFIASSRLIPARRRRISDLPLLIVRIGIVAAAAIALSQSIGRSGDQAIGRSRSGSRVILVDTSHSMRRPTTGGTIAVDSARRLVASLQGASVSRVIETGDVIGSIEGTTAWLETRPGTREIVIISDFQPSALDDGAVARIPKDVGIDLLRIPASGAVPSARSALRPAIEATGKDRDGVEIAWAAVGERPPWDRTNTTDRVTIMYGDVALSGRGVREDSLIDVPWMGALLAGLQSDLTLQAAARNAKSSEAMKGNNVVARNDAGQAIVFARKIDDCLCISLVDEPASLTSVALLRALLSAMNPPVAGAELDTARTGAETLARWERDATPVPGSGSDATDARWFWLAALLLLALETWMRSRQRGDRNVDAVAAAPTTSERAA